jgi:hypothetical protein
MGHTPHCSLQIPAAHAAAYDDYLAVRTRGHHLLPKVGDRLPLKGVPDTKTIATIGPGLSIMAEYPCGHSRELHTLFLRRQLGAGVTLGKVHQKLRCHKCQARCRRSVFTTVTDAQYPGVARLRP